MYMKKTISKNLERANYELTLNHIELINFAKKLANEKNIGKSNRITFSFNEDDYFFRLSNTQVLWQYIRHNPNYIKRYYELKDDADLLAGHIKNEFGLVTTRAFASHSDKNHFQNVQIEHENQKIKEDLISSLDPNNRLLKNFEIGFGINPIQKKNRNDKLNPSKILRYMSSLEDQTIDQYEMIFLSPLMPENFRLYFFDQKAKDLSAKAKKITGGMAKGKDTLSLLVNYIYFEAFANKTSAPGKTTFIKELNRNLPTSHQGYVRGARIDNALEAFKKLSANAPWSIFPFAVPNTKNIIR